MPKLSFTPALKRFFPELVEKNWDADNVKLLLEDLEKEHPGIRSYLSDESGALRQHINIFIDGNLLKDRKELSDEIIGSQEVLIFQALSGG